MAAVADGAAPAEAKVKPETVAEMLNELKIKLKQVDEPYRKS